MKTSLILSALAAGYAAADDVLYSRRLSKRALDDGGHYNICKAALSFTLYSSYIRQYLTYISVY
jgi:hypothetical protein